MLSPTPRRPAAALRQARNQLLESGQLPYDNLVGPVIARSWARSQQAGLTPVGRLPEVQYLNASQLTRLIAHQQEFISHARPIMEYLYSQSRDSGSVVILADDHGVLLQAVGDADFLDRAERVALTPGASWNECHRGTNAIGTALAEAAPVVINGAEHFLERNSFLTCAAATVAAPDGRLLGVLDISGDQRRRHPHTFCLVRTAAQMIENRLFEVYHSGDVHLRFHTLAEGIGTLTEGVLALSREGLIAGANPAAIRQLGLHSADLGSLPLESVFHLRLSELLDWGYRRGHEPMLVEHTARPGRASISRLFVRVETSRVVRQVAVSQPTPPTPRTDALAALDIGCDLITTAIGKARKVLDKPIPVLLQGESGVGKEVFANAMHNSGPRRKHPFIAVDCSALPENLIEAELFGYSPGAFTGARREGSPGRIREAQGGTLFLDEIGDMPLVMQTRLLRVLQQRQVTPLGGSKPVAVDFALISATHRNLRMEMEAGRFRADLYYRINGMTLMLPALRERKDFPALLNHLLEDLLPGRRVALDASISAAFADFSWPGNLRQLVNALRTACALIESDECHIGWQHLPDDLVEELRRHGSRRIVPTEVTENLQDVSATIISRAISLSGGNMSEAARRLGISRNTLYRRLKKIGRS
ncbi:sigma-54-dependent Fis family transcriptional regulator [Thiobacillus sp.]|uniref:sigma-54-dependent Fis family transcriptional regulator n=1 Tax=Thiobacillus sp. TaxID=924 RepID=UPI0011D8E594|nr:sigma-54-dependent Fis family transcriptional regulator [Thiobacillus sp.]TXH75746.1 MAG: sigma-54-dependent Fis family transcriptional regulator [Thiobacillus sp.]